jgi:hypothetical protein
MKMESDHAGSPARFGARGVLLLVLVLCTPAFASAAEAPARKTQNVIIVTIDGFRWQEVFAGADRNILDAPHTSPDAPGLRKQYWRDTPEERRQILMPFFWNTLARQGQVFGDRQSGCIAHTANDRKFSYPGYSEMFCGVADPRIDSNDIRPNPNVNVLEYLNHQPEFAGKVAAYGTWDRLNGILNQQRSGLFCHSGWTPMTGRNLTPAQQVTNEFMSQLPHLWPDNVFDVISDRLAMEHLKTRHPRVLYLMFGETDEWAHMGRYDCYLRAVQLNDAWLARLWKTLQSDPQYAGKTSLVVTTDHGRGATPEDWRNHGPDVKGAEGIWIAVIGPDTPAMGVRKNLTVTQSQVASTIAMLLGKDFRTEQPKAAAPLPGVVQDQ